MFIIVLGPDGSGKSTLINNIIKSELFSSSAPLVLHLNGSNRYTSNIKHTVITNPHGKKPYSSLVSMVKLFYLVTKAIADYYTIDHHYSIKGKHIIYDRHVFDVYADPLRYRIRLSPKIIKLFLTLVPKPDILFTLNVDSKVLWERCTEVSYDQMKIQCKRYMEFSNIYDFVYELNATRSSSEVFDQALGCLRAAHL